MTTNAHTEPLWSRALNQPGLKAHKTFLEAALPKFQADRRIIGILGAGSLITGRMDEYSDLDLVLAVEPEAFDSIMAERMNIAASLGPLLSGFTGEHVGEPRLIICLYGPPPLHVDLKFVSLPDLAKRVEEPAVLWERDGRVPAMLAETKGVYPNPDWQWIEDRFWVWIHYGASKIGRGELMEAVDALSFFRVMVLGPLCLLEAGAKPNGVRNVERDAPATLSDLKKTVALYNAEDCQAAYLEAVDLYLKLRARAEMAARLPAGFEVRAEAERVAVEYLRAVGK